MSEKLGEWLQDMGAYAATNLLPAVIVVVIGILAIRLILRFVTSALDKSRLDKSLYKLVLAVMQPVLYLLLGLMAAEKLGIDVTSVVALASVLTLAVSLSLQNALGNIFGGFTLLYTKPFEPGHYVEIAAREGTVQEVGIAYTKLATADNKIISIPNSSVVAAEIVNYTISGKRRLDITISCHWDTPADTVLQTLLEAARVDTVLEDPAPVVGLKAYADGLAQYGLMVWVNTPDYFSTTFAINQNIQTLFAQKNIRIASPQRTIRTEQ